MKAIAHRAGIICLAFLIYAFPLRAEVIDRVAAFVDDDAITQSELLESRQAGALLKPDITLDEALSTLVNRVLLLREARKLRIEAPDDGAVLNEYIDLKVRAFVRVEERDMEAFYNEHRSEFKGLKLAEVRDKIETYLKEKEVNQSLKRHLEKLRASAYIKINYPLEK